MSEPTRVGLDDTTFSGRLRQPVQDVPRQVVRPQPPMEGGSAQVPWTTLPAQPRVNQPIEPPMPLKPPEPPAAPQPEVKPPPPIWAQQPQPADPVLPPAPASPPEEPIPVPAPQPEPEQPAEPEEPEPLAVVKPEPFAAPADPRPQPSKVLRRHFQAPAAQQVIAKLDPRHYSRAQLGLSGLAVFIFVLGLTVSLQTMQNNHNAIAKVISAAGQSDKQFQNSVQNIGQTASQITGRPDTKTFSEYTVAPDLARYIEIPKLGIVARVSQTGITSKGALGTPDNAYDAAWYTGSVKPGQTGATLIDGLITGSDNKPAIFSDLLRLTTGDLIQIVRGDGSVVNYRVVGAQTYNVNELSMQTALTSAVAGKSGLNLVSMPDTGHPISGQTTPSVLVSAVQS